MSPLLNNLVKVWFFGIIQGKKSSQCLGSFGNFNYSSVFLPTFFWKAYLPAPVVWALGATWLQKHRIPIKTSATSGVIHFYITLSATSPRFPRKIKSIWNMCNSFWKINRTVGHAHFPPKFCHGIIYGLWKERKTLSIWRNIFSATRTTG